MAWIRIDRQKCCECFLCEVICSLQYNPNAVNPKRSRIGAFFSKSDLEVINCDRCGDDPQCLKACLSDALHLVAQ